MASYKNLHHLIILFVVLLVANFNGCNYSFTGASVPPHIKTIAIPNFSDRSGSGEFDLNQKLTSGIIQKFIDDNTLVVSDRLNSDSILEGTVVSLTDAPAVVSGGETITTRRITISVHTVYKDLVKRTTIFDRTFSNFGDYQVVGGDITSVRRQAIETAIEKIAEDILLGIVSNW